MRVQANCTVAAVGPMSYNGSVTIALDESPDTNYFQGKRLFFVAADAMKREMLATALAAISTGRRVWVDLGDDMNPNVAPADIAGTIRSMYII